jgi:hypothetical protein
MRFDSGVVIAASISFRRGSSSDVGSAVTLRAIHRRTKFALPFS